MPQSARADGHGNVIIQIQGDGNRVVEKLPYLELTLYAQRRQVYQQDGREAEADLVSPYTMSIPLFGREDTLKELRGWLDNGAPISARVLVGTAGRGKTRLALHLCEAFRGEDWRTGFLTSGEMERFRSQQNLRSWGWNAPTLIVIDYVASQAAAIHDWLVELSDNEALGDEKAGRERPLRILLLERQADTRIGWWRTAFGEGGGDARAVRRLLDPAKPVVLPAVKHVETRRAVIAAILERAGSKVQPPAAGQDPAFDRRLAELSWGGEPLFLMMAGLVAAQSGFAATLSLSPDSLATELADRELARVCRIAKSKGVDDALAGHMAAVATLCQGLDYEAALNVIEREKAALRYGDAGGAIPVIYEALREALPRDGGGLDPILPDVIGEAAMLCVWDGCDGRDGVPVVLRAAEKAQPDVVATVVRTCQDFAIRGHEEPLRWLEALGERAATDLPVLFDLVKALPKDTLVLREVAAQLTERFLQVLPITGEESTKEAVRYLRATALSGLANRLLELGRVQDALRAGDEAVKIQRELTMTRPDAFRPGLALFLHTLSKCRAAVGRQDLALAAIKEAAGLYCELAAQRPNAFLPELASSLNSLAILLAAVGRSAEALAASEKAVAIQRKLVAAEPAAYRPDVAHFLGNRGNVFAKLGRLDAALADSKEAVAIYRELANAQPDAFLADLAGSLNNLSNRLAAVGQQQEALTNIEEAVRTLKDIFLRPPLAYARQMQGIADNYVRQCKACGREPDMDLLGPIIAALQRLNDQNRGNEDKRR